ncbi:MAG: hypothetical protein OEM96_11295, partial [Gemmatimonadota bacterium]|nr:hypothetical protein [Gemmatimonadota bacterium]
MTGRDAAYELSRIDRTATRIRLAVGVAAVALGLAVVAVSVILGSLVPRHAFLAPGSWIPMGL